jgi:DNA-directed RNA polymerase subunit RPC12/RpoP
MMATESADYPIEPIDFANMRANGVRSLSIRCPECRHERIMNVDHLPGRVIVPSFGHRMVCTYCGTIGADVRPNWRESAQKIKPPRERGQSC